MVTKRTRSALWRMTAFCLSVSGCSSVELIDGAPKQQAAASECQVTVFQTYQQAIERGAIEELCVINGTSSGSFSHSVQTAINKHKNKACGCGATNVYIQSRSYGGLDVATVSMVAFRYKEPQQKQ